MSRLNDIGACVRVWQDGCFPDTDLLQQALVLAEEVGEVCRAVVKTHQRVRPATRGNLAEELADVIIVATALADRAGIDLDAALDARLARLLTLDFTADVEASQRDARPLPACGAVGKHGPCTRPAGHPGDHVVADLLGETRWR